MPWLLLRSGKETLERWPRRSLHLPLYYPLHEANIPQLPQTRSPLPPEGVSALKHSVAMFSHLSSDLDFPRVYKSSHLLTSFWVLSVSGLPRHHRHTNSIPMPKWGFGQPGVSEGRREHIYLHIYLLLHLVPVTNVGNISICEAVRLLPTSVLSFPCHHGDFWDLARARWLGGVTLVAGVGLCLSQAPRDCRPGVSEAMKLHTANQASSRHQHSPPRALRAAAWSASHYSITHLRFPSLPPW